MEEDKEFDTNFLDDSECCDICYKKISREEYENNMGECLICFPDF